MRTIHNWSMEDESWESMREAKRYNPAKIVHWRDKKGKHSNTIGLGNDHHYMFREGEDTYLVSINYRLPYVGLTPLDPDDVFPYEGVFFQEWETDESLGNNWSDKSPMWICKAMIPYLGD